MGQRLNFVGLVPALDMHSVHLSYGGCESAPSNEARIIANCVMEPDPNFDVAVPAASAAPPTARIVLEARSLKKTYGAGARSLPVLVDANLSLRQGEMVAIVAPSGAGRSTLLQLLAALGTPTNGTGYFATKAMESNQHEAVAEF